MNYHEHRKLHINMMTSLIICLGVWPPSSAIPVMSQKHSKAMSHHSRNDYIILVQNIHASHCFPKISKNPILVPTYFVLEPIAFPSGCLGADFFVQFHPFSFFGCKDSHGARHFTLLEGAHRVPHWRHLVAWAAQNHRCASHAESTALRGPV